MKKTYIAPEVQEVDMKSQAILAGSPNIGVNPGEETGTMDSKNFDMFDDED